MEDEYPFQKPIRILKREDQIPNLFDGPFKRSRRKYMGQIGGYKIKIVFNPLNTNYLRTKSAEALETCHKKILEYLIQNPIEDPII